MSVCPRVEYLLSTHRISTQSRTHLYGTARTSPRAYYAHHLAAISAAIVTADALVVLEAAAHLAATAKQLLDAAQAMNATLGVDAAHPNAVGELDAATRQRVVADLRRTIITAQSTVDAIEEALPSLTGLLRDSSRSNHLRTLTDQIGAGAFGEVWKGVLDESAGGGRIMKETVLSAKDGWGEYDAAEIMRTLAVGPRPAARYGMLRRMKSKAARALQRGRGWESEED